MKNLLILCLLLVLSAACNSRPSGSTQEEAQQLSDSAANLIARGEDLATALELLDQSLSKDSSREMVYWMKANLLVEMGQAEKALKMYDDLEREGKFQDDVATLSMHGSLLYVTNNKSQAQEKWKKTVELLLPQLEKQHTPGYFEPAVRFTRLAYGQEEAKSLVEKFWSKLHFEKEHERTFMKERIDTLLSAEEKNIVF